MAALDRTKMSDRKVMEVISARASSLEKNIDDIIIKSKLLGIPKLISNTGDQIAAAVVKCLEDWNIKDSFKAMYFDATASNTGIKVYV